MHNYNNKLYTDIAKVINIESEILCREAEDDFFYFNNITAAYKKLVRAVKLTPFHLRSIMLLANICFIRGSIKKALILYKRAEKISPNNVQILASIANCLSNIPSDYNEALLYCEKALNRINFQNQNLFFQIIEIKINILINKKDYKYAYKTFIQAKNIYNKNNMIYNINYEILNKKIKLQKKLLHSKLKIV